MENEAEIGRKDIEHVALKNNIIGDSAYINIVFGFSSGCYR